jgi:hypothetical protein
MRVYAILTSLKISPQDPTVKIGLERTLSMQWCFTKLVTEKKTNEYKITAKET